MRCAAAIHLSGAAMNHFQRDFSLFYVAWACCCCCVCVCVCVSEDERHLDLIAVSFFFVAVDV